MKVEIATNSIEKINGIKLAFSRFFKVEESSIEFFFKRVDSGVHEQPFNEETYQGALNRVNTLIKNSEKADFFVSCEAGIESFMDNYLNVQIVCIYDNESKNYLWGKSAGWQVPTEHIERIKNNNLNNYLLSEGITCIEELLGPDYSRAKVVAQASEFALASKKLL